MTAVVLIAVLVDRRAVTFRTLAVAAMIVLVLAPEAWCIPPAWLFGEPRLTLSKMAKARVRLKSILGPGLSPTPAAKRFALHRAALFFPQPVPLSAEVIDLGLHPAKEEFSGSRVDPGPLEFQDVLALPSNLDTHVVDFGTNMVKRHHGLAPLELFQSDGAQPPPAGLLARECAGGSKDG
jgi:hypothetical protein